MEHATIIGIDLAKRSFQLHGARPDGSVAFRKKLSRDKVLGFVASHPRYVVAMEACASAHHWGRRIGQLGHAVKLVPPVYVKPFVKRQKNAAADAEAICEAASLKVVMNSNEAVVSKYFIEIGAGRVKVGSQCGGLSATGQAGND